jgi:hypothetical protein
MDTRRRVVNTRDRYISVIFKVLDRLEEMRQILGSRQYSDSSMDRRKKEVYEKLTRMLPAARSAETLGGAVKEMNDEALKQYRNLLVELFYRITRGNAGRFDAEEFSGMFDPQRTSVVTPSLPVMSAIGPVTRYGRGIMDVSQYFYGQSEAEYKEKHLGGILTYDKNYDESTINTIGLYGCKFMAGITVANALWIGKHGKLEPRPEYFNLSHYFDFVGNNKPGTDVLLLNPELQTLIQDASGELVNLDEYIKGKDDLKQVLLDCDNDTVENYVIARFELGGGNLHFVALNGITIDPGTGEVGIKYKEQYDGYAEGKFTFKDIGRLIVIKRAK